MVQRCSFTQFPQWLQLTHLQYNIKTRSSTLEQGMEVPYLITHINLCNYHDQNTELLLPHTSVSLAQTLYIPTHPLIYQKKFHVKMF